MKYLTFIAAFIYSINADNIFQRDISLFEWRYWVPLGFMILGFVQGIFSERES